MINRIRWLAGIIAVLSVTACSTVQFYGQAIGGQLSLLGKREPVDAVIAGDQVSTRIKDKLILSQKVLAFAESRLLLNTGGSYEKYVALDRSYVVWNVFAAPEFSLEPKTWCYPLAGCVAYRGYFSEQGAAREANRLQSRGMDTLVAGVRAYSTLGWFKDPIISTFMDYGQDELAGLLFHELSHQKLYLKGDTVFNESFATAVELEGLTLWLEQKGSADRLRVYQRRYEDQRKVIEMVDAWRGKLKTIYESDQPEDDRRRHKAAAFGGLKSDYRSMRERGELGDYFDYLLSADLNNAHLVAFASYYDRVDAFRNLFSLSGRDFDAFYAQAEKISRLEEKQRNVCLDQARQMMLCEQIRGQ